MKRKTKRVELKGGKLSFGGESLCSVQTMWDRPLKKITPELLGELRGLHQLGCDLIRFAVPTEHEASLLGQLVPLVPLAISADIHFDYRLALRCIEEGVSKIRINPGNIGASYKVKELLKRAKDSDTTIRLGINGGSLPIKLRKEKDRCEAMIKAVEEQLEMTEKMRLTKVVVSLKSSDVSETYQANKRFSQKYPYPLHLGLTEAGPLVPALVKTTLALAPLLREGIGDTLRVSISGSPQDEVEAGVELLAHLGLRESVNRISCPGCGRATFDTRAFMESIGPSLRRCRKKVTVAVMGCSVNGPGEARAADLGITGDSEKAIVFEKGRVAKRVSRDKAEQAFWESYQKL